MVENEVMFKQFNQKVQDGFKELKAVALEEGQMNMIKSIDYRLHFYCECADEKCIERIPIKPSTYEKIHKNKFRFIIVPGHLVREIERSVKTTKIYQIVEKNMTPPAHVDSLNTTNLHN